MSVIGQIQHFVRQRKSIPIIILLLFWAGYTTLNLYQYYYVTQKIFDQENNSRLMRIEFHTDNSISYLVNEQVQPLMEVLDKGRLLKQFDFFLLKKNGEVLTFGNHSRQLASIDKNYTDYAELLDDGKALYKTIKVMDYTLTIGSHKALAPKFFAQIDSQKWILLADIFGVGFLVLLIALYSLRDIRKLSFAFETGQRAEFNQIHSLSREGQALLSGARGLHQSEENVKSAHDRVSKIVGPAILEELKLKKEPPYSISATLVRIDLNGYTQLFLEKNSDYITQVLNLYFKKAHDLIERYHGKIYQFVGDEIVFLIKDHEDYSSQLMALSVIRSLFAEAKKIEQTLAKKEGHSFKLKASFRHGELRFIHLDEGYAFSGLPLIESVRMLGAVKEKNENTVIFMSEDLEKVQGYCTPQEEISMVFKGFSSETKLCQVQKILTVSEAILDKDFNEKNFYYRGDEELIVIFDEITRRINLKQEESLAPLFRHMRTFQIKETSEELRAKLTEFLKIAIGQIKNHHLLATMITVVPQFLTKDKFDTEMKSVLLSALNLDDARVRANTIEVLGKYLSNEDIFKAYLDSPSNRILANALLIEGKKQMKRYIRNKIEEMLESQNELLKASALWVIGELAEHYHAKDYAAYLANPELQYLIKKTSSFTQNENKMVQSRARLTANKINSLQS